MYLQPAPSTPLLGSYARTQPLLQGLQAYCSSLHTSTLQPCKPVGTNSTASECGKLSTKARGGCVCAYVCARVCVYM